LLDSLLQEIKLTVWTIMAIFIKSITVRG